MVIDDKESKGKQDKDATPIKEPKESKDKTINQNKKPENDSKEKPKETTGKSDQIGPKPHPLNPIFISRPKRTIQPIVSKEYLKTIGNTPHLSRSDFPKSNQVPPMNKSWK